MVVQVQTQMDLLKNKSVEFMYELLLILVPQKNCDRFGLFLL